MLYFLFLTYRFQVENFDYRRPFFFYIFRIYQQHLDKIVFHPFVEDSVEILKNLVTLIQDFVDVTIF